MNVELEIFTSYLAERPDPAILDERAADLYLACACTIGAHGAAQVFDRKFLVSVASYVGPLSHDADVISEVRQLLAIRFLVAAGDRPPKIAAYRGTGALEGWVRVAATRMALDLMRDTARHDALDHDLDALIADDRELAYVKERYREPLRAAFAAALRGLPREQRTWIRLHYLEKLTTAELATYFKMSRATSIRRIREAREMLLDALIAEARARLTIGADELESLLSLVRSQLDVSVARLLAESSSY